jgi:hypothetical protein
LVIVLLRLEIESRVERSLDGEGGSRREGRLEVGDRRVKDLLLLLTEGTSSDEVAVSNSGFETETAGTGIAEEGKSLELGPNIEAGLSKEEAAPGDAVANTVLCEAGEKMAALFGAVVIPVECC